MSNIRGAKRRKVVDVGHQARYCTQAWLDCGHMVIRWYWVSKGQTAYCGKCAP